ncbi:RNA-binding protein 33 isoform X2 [Canis lupus baileyi]|uniref:RNA-binding protein 33 n=1 Tax=Canis lupus familiaris TaxID=9615 RepID=A0A8C0SAR7_CANLF|nr:RNA-binding protein 33 isoform X3 [Canis lupus familiaris]XP_025307456.1 RNA-binding protein 33 isoform X3 [Canis lupus dingo]XP_038415739.1 RNA-binding protein 33 isoform X3 [Canis lupus familiaris]XP_038545508.1 RNA-binding protein 33 isoform X3 [Canis lupus familiaris]|eukprot:XP_013975323.1 RNA-binding protein 33 isoform X2 [Canis lupus familiaris]
MAAALGAGGGAGAGDDDFDQFDKPGAERSWRRRAADEDWDSELEDDLLGEDLLSGKKNQSDLSDEELNDDLLQSDNEDEENFSSQGVTISLNTTSGMVTSFELSDNTNDQSGEQESEYEQGEDELVYHKSDGSELYAHEYPEEGQYEGHDAELTEDHMEYVEEPEEEQLYNDEVLDIEINEPLDEFTGSMETLELQKDIKEESDEEDDDDEESGRLRFKTERKEGTIIRLSDVTRERRNIPETLELSAEAKAALLEFEERERQHKQGRYGSRRGGRRGGSVVCRGMGDQRRDSGERARMKDHRPALLPTQPPGVTHSPRLIPPPQPQPPPPPPPPPPQQQPIRSLFQQQQLQPLLPLQHPHHASPPQGVHMPPQIEAPRVMMTPPPVTPQQPKNIHINPHFKGAVVTPVQVPLLPVPSQPRPAVGPQRFPGPPEFPQHTPGPVPSNFSQPPRLPLQDQWRAPPPPQERDPFFLGVSGEPRFPSHLFLEQRSPPPPPPPPTLLSSTHPVPTPSPLPFTQPGPAFNQQGQQPVFPRERPVRPTLQPPGPVGILHFSQPGSAATRPFIPPRQPFLPGPGQPFLPTHAQPNLQGPLHPPLPPPHQPQPQPQQQPPLQPQHQPPLQPPPQHQPPPQPPHQPQHHHHLSVPPPPLMPMSSQPQFRPHVQAAQPPPSSGRMQCPQRQGLRHNTTSQNVTKRPMQQMQPTAPRNSNLRELPIAPSHVMEMSSSRCSSTPAAPVKPLASTSPPTRPGGGPRSAQGKTEAKVKPVSPVVQPKEEAKTEPEFPDEDEETRLYRLKIEEQKRLREEILKQKELRRQQQAGARKKELLERLAQQQQLHLPPTAAEQEQQAASPLPTNGNPLLPFPGAQVRQNVKNRLLVKNQDVTVSNVQPKTSNFVPSGANMQYQGQQMKPLKHLRQARTVPQSPAQHKVLQVKPADGEGPPPPSQTARVASLQGRPPDAKPGAKRTVMHRANSGGGDGPHVSSKVRVIKLSGGQGGESDGFFHPEGQPQRLPQPPEVRQQPARKVTLTKGALQQPQHPPVGSHVHSAGPPGIKSIQGVHPAKKVIMHGRGRGVAGPMGRGRLMPNKQNLRVVECKPQPCVVSVEGLSSSTTDVQLKNLLMSVGPIQSLQMLPQQRKAIAKFKEPAHALAFQQKFHRHMIDLSHINVALIVE